MKKGGLFLLLLQILEDNLIMASFDGELRGKLAAFFAHAHAIVRFYRRDLSSSGRDWEGREPLGKKHGRRLRFRFCFS